MFRKINLKFLLGTIISVPILVMGGISVSNIIKEQKKLNNIKLAKENVNVVNLMENVLKALGEERGTTAIVLAKGGYIQLDLGSKKLSVKTLIDKKRENLDKAVIKLKRYIETNKNRLSNINTEKLLKTLDKIKSIRKEVDRISTVKDNKPNKITKEEFNKIFKEYTEIPKTILSVMDNNIIKNFPLKEAKAPILPISRFMTIQEVLGQTRETLSFYMTKKIPLESKLYQKFFIREMANPKYVSYQIGGKKVIKLFNSEIANFLENKYTKIVFKIEQDLQNFYKTKKEFKGYSIPTRKMFLVYTKKIVFLKNVNNLFAEKENAILSKVKNETLINLYKNYGILVLLGFLIGILLIIAKKTNKYLRKLDNLITTLGDKLGGNSIDYREIKLETEEGIRKALDIIKNTIIKSEEQRKKAEEAVKAKSLFLANMSHEIRTPLNGILGFLELLKTTPLNELQDEYVNTISQSSKNLLQIVNNILNVSKIESNKVELELIDTKFIDEIENTIEIFGAPTAQKRIKYISFLDPSIPEIIKTDPVKIKEIMTNLINNAIKFTPENGQIYVEISNKGIKTDEYGRKKVALYFEVKDTGIGMTNEQKEKVFEAFSQADETITRKYGGTGLGLALVKNYIEMMGGEIQVESQINKGTKFFFELEFEIKKEEPKYPAGKYEDKTFAILVPERKTSVYDVVEKYLKYFGINQVSITSNEELESIKSKVKVDGTLVFYEYSDISKIKELTNNRIPTIILTSHYYKDEIEAFKALNVYDPIFASKINNIILAIENKKVTRRKTSNKDLEKKELYDLTALIAEDNPINMKLLKTTLEKMGLKTDTAVNGLEAFNKYSMEPEKYDVIFMDMQMPVMSGVEATHEILEFEKQENIPHIPIIAATANALENDRERFLGQGLDDYISKPIKVDEIKRALENVINGVYGNSERIMKEKNNTKEKVSTEKEEKKETSVINENKETVSEENEKTEKKPETKAKKEQSKQKKENLKENEKMTEKTVIVTDTVFFKDLFEVYLDDKNKEKVDILTSKELLNKKIIKDIKKIIIAGKLNHDISAIVENIKNVYLVENNDYRGHELDIKEIKEEIKNLI